MSRKMVKKIESILLNAGTNQSCLLSAQPSEQRKDK